MRLCLDRLIAVISFLMLLGANSTHAQQIHLGVGTEQISVSSSFNGDDLLIFGAVEDEEVGPSDKQYDVIVVMRGPSENVRVRKKKRILGIWVNAETREADKIPASFSVSSTRDLHEITTAENVEQLALSLAGIQTNIASDRGSEFASALLRLKSDNGLYVENSKDVEFITRKLFRARVEIPAHVPIGRHSVTGYLFESGKFIGSTQTIMRVRKVGFEEFTYRAAHENSLLYGIVCVILAMFAGWTASVVFRRN